MTTPPSDLLDCVGFLRSDVWPLLAKGGIEVPEVLSILKPPSLDWPEWKKVMALLPTLSDTEVASAFAGVDLKASSYRSPDEFAEVSRWSEVIHRSIMAAVLPAKAVNFEKDGEPSEWSITPVDLAAWCVANNREYPLPTRLPLPPTDAGLRAALTQSDQERAQWKEKAETLALVDDQCVSLQDKIRLLRENMRRKADELEVLTLERDQLKVEALNGKSRTTALKIIGGMAIDAYRVDIHSDRMNNIGELERALQTLGASVNAKTLREWLKDAAKVVDPKK